MLLRTVWCTQRCTQRTGRVGKSKYWRGLATVFRTSPRPPAFLRPSALFGFWGVFAFRTHILQSVGRRFSTPSPYRARRCQGWQSVNRFGLGWRTKIDGSSPRTAWTTTPCSTVQDTTSKPALPSPCPPPTPAAPAKPRRPRTTTVEAARHSAFPSAQTSARRWRRRRPMPSTRGNWSSSRKASSWKFRWCWWGAADERTARTHRRHGWTLRRSATSS